MRQRAARLAAAPRAGLAAFVLQLWHCQRPHQHLQEHTKRLQASLVCTRSEDMKKDAHASSLHSGTFHTPLPCRVHGCALCQVAESTAGVCRPSLPALKWPQGAVLPSAHTCCCTLQWCLGRRCALSNMVRRSVVCLLQAIECFKLLTAKGQLLIVCTCTL